LALAVAPMPFGAHAATAGAATYCVALERAGCAERPTAAAAFESARADAGVDTILLGRIAEAGAFADAAGRPVRVVGLGPQATVLRAAPSAPTLRVADPGTTVTGVRLEGAPALQLDAGGRVRSVVAAGRVTLRGGGAELDSVVISAPGPALEVGCELASSELDARHVTVAGSGPSGISPGCNVPGRAVTLRVAESIVWGFDRAFATGPRTTVGTRYSDYPGATGGPGNLSLDPGFAGPGDLRLRAGSPLVDAGRPGALDAGEPHEDVLGFLRAADGDGDGTARRDMGAFEQQPAPPSAAGNLLTNGGAEAGSPATDDKASPAPPGWSRTGAFTSVRYGTLAGEVPFPSRRIGEALDAGEAFFAGGPGPGASATQVADLSPWAPEVDLGEATAELSALLGGYRGSQDGAIVQAEFRDPRGVALRSLRIGPVTAEQRAGATALAHRAEEVRIPALARSVAVTMRSTPPAGSYDDAYFDRVALVARIGGAVAPDPPPADGEGAPRRPYAGVTLLSPRAVVDRRRRAWVRLACPSATAGRCRGAVTLTARGRRAGGRPFSLRPGRRARLPMALTPAAGRALRARRRLPGRVYVATRDGQDLSRTRTSPVRIVRGALWRRGR
jgi:hypothetical protein